MLEDIQEEIIEELPDDELSEELLNSDEGVIIEESESVEELPIDEFTEEITDIQQGDLSVEEITNDELQTVEDELSVQAELDPTVTPAQEDDTNSYEEETLSKITEITETAGIIQANQKTGIENLMLLSTCSLSLLCMIFGGFVIHCFLNRLG